MFNPQYDIKMANLNPSSINQPQQNSHQQLNIQQSSICYSLQNIIPYKHNWYIFLQIIIIYLLVCPTLSSTDISLQNCPSQFNLTEANQTTKEDENFVKSFYLGFSNTADRARIEEIVVTGNKTALKQYINEKIVPYGIYGGIIFLVFLALLYYCVFDKSFPPCQKLRRNPIQKPYTKNQKRCMSYSLLILTAIIFATGIVSFTTIPKMRYNISYTKCAIFNLIDLTINGETGSGWGGMQSLLNNIGNISSLLDSANTQVGTYLTSDEWLVNDMVVMNNKNMDIYNRNKDAQYISPNPTETANSMQNGQGYPKVDSVFIKTGLGPNGTFGTMVDDIDRGLRVTQSKGFQAYQIEAAAQSMVENTNTIKTNIVAAQNSLNMYLQQFNTSKSQTDTLLKQFFEQYFTFGIYILQGVVGFILVSSLLVLIGGISTHFYEIFECRFMVHFGWFFYSLLYFGMLIIGYVTLSLGTAGYYSCIYFNESMHNSSAYSRIGKAYAQNIFVKLDVCILGDGDALKKFNINNEMRVVKDLFTNISTYFDQDSSTSSNYIDLNISLNRIQGWIDAIKQYRLGYYIDSKSIILNDDNPNIALKSLNNILINTNCTVDRWVYDSRNCSAGGTIYENVTPVNGTNLTPVTGSFICISFNSKITDNSPYSWSQADVISRYLQIRQSCTQTVYGNIMSYISTLTHFRDSRVAMFQGIQDQLIELKNLNLNYNNMMQNYRSKVNQFNSAVGTLNDIVLNEDSGLLYTTNCATIGNTAKAAYNIFCINFMSQIVKIGICALIMLITMMFAMCIGAIFGVRYANVEMLKRVNADHHEQIAEVSQEKMDRMGFDKEIAISERSQSSDQDANEKRR